MRFFLKKGFKYGMHHARKCNGGESMWNEVQHDYE
jgi:hypothetical protein